MDSLKQLKRTSLLPCEPFRSSLKNKDISVENCNYCQKVWTDGNMITFKNFLFWYNNADIVSFLETLDKQVSVYADCSINMLDSGISLLGLAVRWAHASLQPRIEVISRVAAYPDNS